MTDRIYYAPMIFTFALFDGDIISFNPGVGVNTTFYGIHLVFENSDTTAGNGLLIRLRRGTGPPGTGTSVTPVNANSDDAASVAAILVATNTGPSNADLATFMPVQPSSGWTLIPPPEARWKIASDEFLTVTFDEDTTANDISCSGWLCWGES